MMTDNDSSEDEYSQNIEGKVIAAKDPFSSDPCFETKEDMQIYLQSIGHKDVIILKDNVEIEKADKDCVNNCTCLLCTGLKIRKCQHLLFR